MVKNKRYCHNSSRAGDCRKLLVDVRVSCKNINVRIAQLE